LNTLMEFGDFEELPLIFKCLRDQHMLIREKACQAIGFFWKKAERLNAEETLFRGLHIDDEDLDYFRIDFDEENYLTLIGIASLNRNGFIREKSVNELGRLHRQQNLKFILLRLRDWVTQVRFSALTAVKAYIGPEDVKGLMAELPLIDQLLDVRRTDLATVHEEIVQCILEHASPQDVNAFGDGVRLRYYRHFFKQCDIDESVAGRIFGDSNFLIRLLVLNQAAKFSIPFQKSIVRLALKDKATLVKRKALDKARQFLPNHSGEMQSLLLDKTYSVRESARTLLKPTGMDYIDFYRQNIESGGVMGLCDIGGNEYLALYKKHAYSTQARVSTCCLLALNKFDRQLAIQYSLDMLGHRSGMVRRVAIGILADQATRESLNWVRERCGQGDLRIKVAAMTVLKRVGGWSVLPDLMDSLSDENADVRKLGWQLLAKWRVDLARLFVQPNLQDLERARQSLKQVALTYKTEMSNWQDALLKQITFFLR
jgi:hypothetical protein